MAPVKPNLATAKRMFKRRNDSVPFTAEWKRRPVHVPAEGGRAEFWTGSVVFRSPGYAPKSVTITSDAEGVAIY